VEAVATYHDWVRNDALAVLPQRVGRVLDFGGGVGATAARLRNDGRADHAVLFDQVADNAAPGIDAAASANLDTIADVRRLLAQHGPFDTVLCLDILEHLSDPWAIVGAIEAAMAPGALLVVSVPNVRCYQVVLPLVFRDRWAYVDAGVLDRTHLRWFTRSSAITLAQGSGLAVQTVRPGDMRRRDRLLNRLTLGMFERFLALQYLVVVRKPG
jgi:2-polyprenyl-3-methyl-5-hydroxy-6-metoxy-1,4-benzoquinol methylase